MDQQGLQTRGIGAEWLRRRLHLGQPGNIPHHLRLRRLEDLRRTEGARWAGVINLLRPLVTCFLGLIVYHWIHVMHAASPLENQDQAFPFALRWLAPDWGLRGIILAGFLAAVMSATSALANSTATIFSLDVYRRIFHPDAHDMRLVWIGRAASVPISTRVRGTRWPSTPVSFATAVTARRGPVMVKLGGRASPRPCRIRLDDPLPRFRAADGVEEDRRIIRMRSKLLKQDGPRAGRVDNPQARRQAQSTRPEGVVGRRRLRPGRRFRKGFQTLPGIAGQEPPGKTGLGRAGPLHRFVPGEATPTSSMRRRPVGRVAAVDLPDAVGAVAAAGGAVGARIRSSGESRYR